MNHKKVLKQISLFIAASLLSIASIKAEETKTTEEVTASPQAEMGMAYFQGKKRFENGGPTCITCHNVKNDAVMPGGLFAKDLTDVYERLNEGITGWLGAPPFPAMAASYNNNPLTEEERMSLTAFFKYANEVKDSQRNRRGYKLFIMGGIIGLVSLLIIFQLLWSNRKKKMVKQDIFIRQSRAADAKF